MVRVCVSIHLEPHSDRAPKWDRRYFELATSGHLYYYKKKEDDKPTGSIFLKGCPTRIDPEDKLNILMQSGVYLCIRACDRCSPPPDDRLYTLKCSTEAEAQDWLNDLLFYA